MKKLSSKYLTVPYEATDVAVKLEDMAQALFGRGRKVAMDNLLCVMCGGDANYFADELSRKEYGISGMCQTCQDKTFA